MKKCAAVKVVLDTNVLVSSLSSRSQFHWVIIALRANRFMVVLSHQILLEYEEVLVEKYGALTTRTFLDALVLRKNVQVVDPRFHWHFLKDVDDDKFVDAAIAAGADYIVTEDRDFRALEFVEHPLVIAIKLAEFESILFKIE